MKVRNEGNSDKTLLEDTNEGSTTQVISGHEFENLCSHYYQC